MGTFAAGPTGTISFDAAGLPTAKAQTTHAGAPGTDLLIYTPADGTVTTLTLMASARKSDGSSGGGYHYTYTFRKQGGTVHWGGGTSLHTKEDNPALNLGALAWGGTMRLQAFGIDGETHDWTLTVLGIVESP